MRLVLRIDGRFFRRWHLDLLARLDAVPELETSLVFVESNALPDPSVALLLRFETLLHGYAGKDAFALVPATDAEQFTKPTSWAGDLTLDLTASCEADAGPAGGRRWRLTFDGQAGESALIASLLAGRAPLAEIVEQERVVAAGRLGTEHHAVLPAVLADVLHRLITLIIAALTGASPAVPALPGDEAALADAAAMGVAGLAKRAGAGLISTMAGRVYRGLYHTPHWRVGWRKLDGPDLFDLRRLPEAEWQTLPDDGSRFYADPFPVFHNGRVTLFVEDYRHATGKGIISAVEFGPDGPLGRPEPVLEQDGHLSYPFVFAREGEVWMIPESCSAGRVDLFRATAFPGGWVKEATLIDGIVASDATLIEHHGRWWLFATVRDGGGAFSDALHLWSAPDFRGPWTPHPRNPVMIDIASARPAGQMVLRDGVLLRPVQDCRLGYGRALGIAIVTQLDEGGFAQSVEAIIRPGPSWPGRRLHTLNSAGGFEFIDGSAASRRALFR